MAHAVDLGTYVFNADRQAEHYLISRGVATLLDAKEGENSEPECQQFNWKDSWITMARNLALEIYFETSRDPVLSMDDLVKQAVQAMEMSVLCQRPSLSVSRIRHAYHCSSNTVTLHVSIVLSQVPDTTPRTLPRRVPLKVKEFEAEPQPSAGIRRATISQIVIHMRTLRCLTPWSLFLAGLWLNHPESARSSEGDAQYMHSQQRRFLVTLSPTQPARCPLGPETKSVYGTSQSRTRHDRLAEFSRPSIEPRKIQHLANPSWLNQVIHYSLGSLIDRHLEPQCSQIALESGPNLVEIVPLVFKEGHYENIKQRAGLIPVIARSLTKILRTSRSAGLDHKVASVKAVAGKRYGFCQDKENEKCDHLSRATIKCIVWTALQRATFRLPSCKKSSQKGPSTMALAEEILLQKDSQNEEEIDREILHSTTDSIIESMDDMSSRYSDADIDSGYSSYSSAQNLFLTLSEDRGCKSELIEDYYSKDSANDDCESHFTLLNLHRENTMIDSSSLPLATSDVLTETGLSDRSILSSDLSSDDSMSEDFPEEKSENDMIVDSYSVSELSFLTYYDLPKEVKQENNEMI